MTFQTQDPLALGGETGSPLGVGGLVEAAAAIVGMLCADYEVSLRPLADDIVLGVTLFRGGTEVTQEWIVSRVLKAADPLVGIAEDLGRLDARSRAIAAGTRRRAG